jgi:hypothetical protein
MNMVKLDTLTALQKSTHPLFVSLSDKDVEISIAAFADAKSSNIIISNGNETVHSPLTGLEMTNISVNDTEEASSNTPMPVAAFKSALVAIASCTAKKRKRPMSPPSEVA